MNSESVVGWRARPIFITSTFSDMQAERDYLRNHVFPILEERLQARRHHLESIDLRWGIDSFDVAESEARELLVLKVCLREIGRSRPFLIGLIGDRYGWTPPESRVRAAAAEQGFSEPLVDTSITALEIEYALHAAEASPPRCHVYLRAPLPFDTMPLEVAARYSDLHNSTQIHNAAKLAALKQRLKDHPALAGRVHDYRGQWDPGRQRVVELEAWGEQVLEHLWQDLDAETIAFAEGPAPSLHADDRWALEAFVAERLRDFVEREELTRRLTERILFDQNDARVWGSCVTGASGTGKSTIFARLHREFSGRPDVLALTHAAGVNSRSASLDAMLRRWIDELAMFLGESADEASRTNTEALERVFGELLARAAQQRRIVLLVDALNQFERTLRARQVGWLPTLLPSGVSLIATTLAGPESEALSRRGGVELLPMPQFGRNEAEELAKVVCRRHHRQLNPSVLELLLKKKNGSGLPASSNPLWLGLAVEELNLLDADDFELTGSYPKYSAIEDEAQRLIALLRDEADALPADADELYARVLARTERLFGRAWVAALASLLAVSRHGWRESDLQQLLPAAAAILFPERESPPCAWSDLLFAAVRRSFRYHLGQRGGHACWNFVHAQLRDTVRVRYLSDTEMELSVQQLIADHLHDLPADDELRKTELVHHRLICGQARTAAILYCDGPIELQAATDAFAERAATGSPSDPLAGVKAICEPLESREPNEAFLLIGICNRYHTELLPALQDAVPLRQQLMVSEATGRAMTWVMTQGAPKHFDHDLATSHQTQGRLAHQLGDFALAVACYGQAIPVFRRLFQHEGSETSFRALAHCYLHLGRTLLRQRNLAGAESVFAEALGMVKQLLAHQPDDCISAHDVLDCQSLLSDVHAAGKRWDLALETSENAMAQRQQLAARPPSQSSRSLHLNHGPTGGGGFCPVPTGEVREFLRERPPTIQETEHRQARDLGRCGRALRELGRLEEAGAALEQSVNSLRHLLVLDPANRELQEDLARNIAELATTAARRGLLSQSRAAAEEALALRQQLAERRSDHATWQEQLAAAHEVRGAVALSAGDQPAAIAAFEESLSIRRKLAAAQQRTPEWQRGLLETLDWLARHSPEPEAHHRAAEEVAQTLRKLEIHDLIVTAKSCVDQGGLASGLELLKSCREPDDLVTNAIGVCLLRSGEISAARGIFENLLGAKATCPQGHAPPEFSFYLAVARALHGDLGGSLAAALSLPSRCSRPTSLTLTGPVSSPSCRSQTLSARTRNNCIGSKEIKKITSPVSAGRLPKKTVINTRLTIAYSNHASLTTFPLNPNPTFIAVSSNRLIHGFYRAGLGETTPPALLLLSVCPLSVCFPHGHREGAHGSRTHG